MSYTVLGYFLIGFVLLAIMQLRDLGQLQTTAAAFTIVIFIKFSASTIISAIRESNKGAKNLTSTKRTGSNN